MSAVPYHEHSLFYRIGLTARRIFPAIADLATGEVYVLASAVAFNALLSFFPFVLLLALVCRHLFQWKEGPETIFYLLEESYLPVAQEFIVSSLRKVLETNIRGGVAVFSFFTLAFTSAGVFTPLELALNRAWKVKKPRAAWKSQLLAMSLVVIVGAFALGVVYLTANAQWLLRAGLGGMLDEQALRTVGSVITKFMSLPATVVVFFILYSALPSERPPVMRVLPTALWVGILWEIAKYAFVACLPLLNFAKVYGPFYVTVTLVFWAFISALLLLLGANLASLDARKGDEEV